MQLVTDYGTERQTGQEMPNDAAIERTYAAVREYAKALLEQAKADAESQP